MAASDGFTELLQDLLAPLGAISIRRMFGGAGVYCNGTMFGLIDDDALYLKVDDTNRPDFQAEDLRPFVYDGKGKPIEMSYWRAPERLLDDPDEMLDWARKAVAVSLRARKAGTTKPAATAHGKAKPRRPKS